MSLSKHYVASEREPELERFWQESGVYHFDRNPEAPIYSIDTPPPTVSGHLHLGMSRRQIRRMVRHESVITSLLGATMGIGLGLGLAALVTAALHSDGLRFVVPAGSLIVFLVIAVLAGMAAAIAPARRASRMKPLAALAYE